MRLNLSRSAVGKAISRLETRLGVRLFYRTTRSQSLTEDGQSFYERCLRALDEIRMGEALLESGRSEVVGRLRVSMPVLFGRRCVAPILVDLARQHPKLELDLNFTDRPVDLIEDGFDLAIRNGSAGDLAGLVGRRIARQTMAVCAAPTYLAVRGRPQSLDDLAAHDAVTYGRAGLVKSWSFQTGEGQFVECTPRTRLRLDDLETIADAAVAGMGLAWLPCWLIRDHVAAGRLYTVLDDRKGIVFDIHALWPKAPHMPPRVRFGIDALVGSLPGTMS